MEVGVLEVNERLFFFFKIYIVEFGFWLCSYADLFVFFLVPWRLWRTATPLKNQKDLERRGSQRPSKFNADDFYSFFIFTYCKSSEKSIWNQRTVCHKKTHHDFQILSMSGDSRVFLLQKIARRITQTSQPLSKNQLRPKNRTRCSLCSPCFALHHGRS